MKATLKKISQSRSLQRRWALADAEPVRSYLPTYTEFVPADLRIWWSAEAGEAEKDHTLHIYAWPAERENHLTATWRNGYNHDPIPRWIRELSNVVHEDLITNATSTNTGTEDQWAYSIDCDWILEDAPPIPSFRNPNKSFVPTELSIWHSLDAGDSGHDRHRITAYPTDRNQREYADWGGGVDWEGKPRYNADLPQWIRELAEEQFAQVVDFATKSEQERGTR
jgi:hypothetical protein